MKEKTLTQEILKEYLHYDPETGIFTWIKKIAPNASKMVVGKQAGRFNKGYISIGLFGMEHKAHRLAWLYVYGTFPEKYIDHINGIKTDNRLSNLRDVSRRMNNLNYTVHRNGKLPGTQRHGAKWVATAEIKENGKWKKKYLGRYVTEQEAHEAYMTYVQEHNLL